MSFFLFEGLTTEDEKLFKKFLERVEVIGLEPYFDELIISAISMRKNLKLKLPDAIIAATALSANAVLVTSDNDLKNIPGLIVGLLKDEIITLIENKITQ